MFHSVHLSIGTGPCAKKKKKDMRGTDRLATVVLCAIITERNHCKQYQKYIGSTMMMPSGLVRKLYPGKLS